MTKEDKAKHRAQTTWYGRSFIQRFWDKVTLCSHGAACVYCCWPWSAARNEDGYGMFRLRRQGGMDRAHIVGYLLVYGEIPPGMEIDHICANRACENPAHWEAITHALNIQRAATRRTACKHGHEYTIVSSYLQVRPSGKRARICRICRSQGRIALAQRRGGWKYV